MSKTLSSGPLRAVQWADATGNALRAPSGTARELATVLHSYRVASFGDSRARVSGNTVVGFVGSGSTMEQGRFPAWACAYLVDAECVADFSVGGDTLAAWNSPSRAYGKTILNLLACRPDVVVVQYGINDLPSATSATLIAAAKSLVSKLLAANIKVLLQNIQLFDPTAPSAAITPANAAATLTKINEFRDAMSDWLAPMTGRAVFVDPNPLIADGSGYGDPQYFFADGFGVHSNKRGGQLMGQQAAVAMRSLLPPRNARAFTTGPLSQPNLIDWAASAASNATVLNSQAGTTTSSAVTWNLDADSGVPYVETTITPTALASGRALAMVQVSATDIAGGSPRFPIFIGDVLQGSARIVIDDGSGGAAALQSVDVRHRMYNTGGSSQFFSDWGGVSGVSDLTTLPLLVDGRFTTAMCVCPIASANIQSPTAGGGYYLGVFVETTALDPIRVRIYAPSLRVVSRAQPLTVTAGASPYAWMNGPLPTNANDWVNVRGRRAAVTVAPGAGGTISKIELTRGASVGGTFLNPADTYLTSGTFIVEPGDGLRVTWATTAARLTVVYLDDLTN